MMGLASVFMAVASISRLRSGENIMNVLPTIAMAGAMVIRHDRISLLSAISTISTAGRKLKKNVLTGLRIT